MPYRTGEEKQNAYLAVYQRLLLFTFFYSLAGENSCPPLERNLAASYARYYGTLVGMLRLVNDSLCTGAANRVHAHHGSSSPFIIQESGPCRRKSPNPTLPEQHLLFNPSQRVILFVLLRDLVCSRQDFFCPCMIPLALMVARSPG